MNSKQSVNRIVAALICAVMLLTMLPFSAFAAEGTPEYTAGNITASAVYVKVSQLKSGSTYLIVASGYALENKTSNDSSVDGVEVTVVNGKIEAPVPANLEFVLTEDGDKYSVKGSNGYYMYPSSGQIVYTKTDMSVVFTERSGGSFRISYKGFSTYYLKYKSGAFTASSGTSGATAFDLYEKQTTYTADASYATGLLAYVAGFDSDEYTNWSELDMASLITACATASAASGTVYTTQAAAAAAQANINNAAKALYDAAVLLTNDPLYAVTLTCTDGTDSIGEGTYTVYLPAGQQSVTPPVIYGYISPEAAVVEVTEDGEATAEFVYTPRTKYVISYEWTGLPAGNTVALPENGTGYGGENFTAENTYSGASVVTVNGTKYYFGGWQLNGASAGTFTVTGNTTLTGVWSMIESNVLSSGSLILEYWITNVKAFTQTNNSGSSQIALTTASIGINTESGVAVKDIAPICYKETRELAYWRSRMLNKDLNNTSTSGTEEQTTYAGDDDTMNGVGFTKIRFWYGKWQVFTTASEWVSVAAKANGTVINQLVAYYAENIKVADEVEVYAADWGTKADGSSSWGYKPENDRCSVTVQIVYPDGTTNPPTTTAADIRSKTILYGYWSGGRGLGTMIFNETAGYDIYKITAETGAVSSSVTNTTYVTANSFSWDDNEKTVWQEDGSDPVISNDPRHPTTTSPYDNLMWDEANEAILIRLYVNAVTTVDTLTVNYVDNTTGSKFYSYNITVSDDYTPNTFSSYDIFANVDQQIAEIAAEYIVNSLGATQRVQSNLSLMPQIALRYQYGGYEFTNMTKSADNKTITLYYDFDNTYTFIADYGLPMVVASPEGYTAVTIYEAVGGNFGKLELKENLTINGVTGDYLVYTPSTTEFYGADRFNVTIVYTDGTTIDCVYVIIPATSVYYEDNFVSFINASDTANAETGGVWEIVTDGEANTHYQTGNNIDSAVEDDYGYDSSYKDLTNSILDYSAGTAHKVTVKGFGENGAETTFGKCGAWPTASFCFRGTGFDLISRIDGDAGMILIDVTDVNGAKVKRIVIDNHYGYISTTEVVDGQTVTKWKEDKNSTNTVYQVPVIKVSDLAYGAYNVKVTAIYVRGFDHNASDPEEGETVDLSTTFYLDAIRVYNPVQNDTVINGYYEADAENAPSYTTVRDLLVNAGSLGTNDIAGATFIDGNSNTTDISTYALAGPNNETYLAYNQAITFKLITDNAAYVSKLTVGARLLRAIDIGAAVTTAGSLAITGATFKNNEDTLNITSANDMNYQITPSFDENGKMLITLRNSSEGTIIALTNIKVSGGARIEKYTPALVQSAYTAAPAYLTITTSEETATAGLEAVARMMYLETPFVPENIEITADTILGRTTLTVTTSADVERVIVNGLELTANLKLNENGLFASTGKTEKIWTLTTRVISDSKYAVTAYDADGRASVPVEVNVSTDGTIR